MCRIGVRREDKNEWERRVPIVPLHARELFQRHHVQTVIQPSKIRIFSDDAYRAAGAQVTDDISDCRTIFAIKEIPVKLLQPGRTYIFFSHTIKGQTHNMPMLKRLMELNCQLVDYERIVNEQGKRLVAFGRFAGIAGMLDTLWAFGRRLSSKGIKSPFLKVKRAYEYRNVEEAKEHIRTIGDEIRTAGIDAAIAPLICGFTGYGNVSGGAQEVFDCLPTVSIAPESIATVTGTDRHTVHKAVFAEQHMVVPVSEGTFHLKDYYEHPSRYRSIFHSYIPSLTMLMNCIYWEEKYPRLLKKAFLRQLFSRGTPKLEIIGDISCDIEGSIECTVRATEPDKPVYVFDPLSNTSNDGYEGRGVVIMAVDNLPCEMPAEASEKFSTVLMPFIPEIAHADYSGPFESWYVSREVRDATILYHGKLTERFHYLNEFLR